MATRTRAAAPISTLAKYFLRGLIVVAPIAVTVIAVRWTFAEIDTWINVEPLLNRKVPGAGFVVTVVAITVVGFLASNFATRWLFLALEEMLERTPLVKLIYSSLKDIVGAFVGEKKKFNQPVIVALTKDGEISTFGFVTRPGLAELGMHRYVAVYVPQAYNIGGNVITVPEDRVKPLDADPGSVMTFIVSGGVTGELARPE